MPPRPSNSPSSYRPPTVVGLLVMSMVLPQPRLPFSAIRHRSTKWASYMDSCVGPDGVRFPPNRRKCAGNGGESVRFPPNTRKRPRDRCQRRTFPTERAKTIGWRARSDSFVACCPAFTTRRVVTDRKLLQSSERAACHSAVLDWHSDKLLARSDSFVACCPAFTTRRVVTDRKLLQSSERAACHSAVLDWHSDKLLARSDSFVA